MDFGDCHKSLFAHKDAIMAVSFVPNTHYVFTAGKDRLVKYWDVDRCELLLELPGHHSEVWALAVAHYGDFIISGEWYGLLYAGSGAHDTLIDHVTRQRLCTAHSSKLRGMHLD